MITTKHYLKNILFVLHLYYCITCVNCLYFLKLSTLAHSNKGGGFRTISLLFHTYYCTVNGIIPYIIPHLIYITEHCIFFSFGVHLCCYVVALALRLPVILHICTNQYTNDEHRYCSEQLLSYF